VRLLVDETLPPRVAQMPADAGHDAVHVRDLDAAGASDQKIIGLALNSGRTIISADTDFGALRGQADR
jgi:predicted nuclease of predicted toxin-antitoxin system